MQTLPESDWLDSLIRHEVAYFRMVATAEFGECAWFLSSPDLPDYHDANHALRLRDDGRGPGAVARSVAAHFRSRGLPVVADVDEVAERIGIGRSLRQLGITPVIGDTLLMRYESDQPPAGSYDCEVGVVIKIGSQDEMEMWVDTAASDDRDGENATMWREVLERESRFNPCTLYLGRVDGRPAGACDLFSQDGWGRVESVATRPQFRRRGVAYAVVSAAVRDSLDQGNAVTYLYVEAGSDAERLYRRIGFVPWRLNPLRRHMGR